jgi:hypothetical protein
MDGNWRQVLFAFGLKTALRATTAKKTLSVRGRLPGWTRQERLTAPPKRVAG